jgi:DNA replicative helicase MCM subunit Mcm2 (Cdc46/Mcm family)
MFGCESCGTEKLVAAACGRLEEPQRCDQCNKSWTMKLLHNRCWFQNKQLIKMQVQCCSFKHHTLTWTGCGFLVSSA